jgi:hypothetical protein
MQLMTYKGLPSSDKANPHRKQQQVIDPESHRALPKPRQRQSVQHIHPRGLVSMEMSGAVHGFIPFTLPAHTNPHNPFLTPQPTVFSPGTSSAPLPAPSSTIAAIPTP